MCRSIVDFLRVLRVKGEKSGKVGKWELGSGSQKWEGGENGEVGSGKAKAGPSPPQAEKLHFYTFLTRFSL